MKRVYSSLLQEHFDQTNKSAFLSGARQVGKTTIAQDYAALFQNNIYLTWDSFNDREKILRGQNSLLTEILSLPLAKDSPVVIFDEIHKYNDWKTYIKGFIDLSKDKVRTIVTGSSKLNVYRRGGDSMMGRYFLYRVHPLSLREITQPTFSLDLIQSPIKPESDALQNLFDFGGFPEPFVNGEKRFHNRWQMLRQQQLFSEDIRELTKIHEIKLMETLTHILKNQAAQLLNYANLAVKIRVSEPTIASWINVLEQFYFCFSIKPWHHNITRSLLKTQKLYLWDWTLVDHSGERWENLVACHLNKSVNFWTDAGLGQFDLFYLRDKDQREVDFLITKDSIPWILVEVKSSGKESLSKSLIEYQKITKAPHAFQVAMDLPYVDVNCFDFVNEPKIVSAPTFLSQLV
jgi:predicted AAA+ superfamily ATPase